jgi:drug/metabolite transporter (DMT)-like permease
VKGSLLLGTLLVAAAAMMFGTLSFVSRQADAAGVGAYAFVFWRGALAVSVLVGVLLLGVASRRARLPSPRLLSRRQRVSLAVAASAGAVLNVALFVAFLRTEIAVVLISFYIFPAIVTVGAIRLYGERLDPVRGVALVMALGGLALVLLAPITSAGGLTLDLLGVGLALLAAGCQATFLLLSGRGYPPFRALDVSIYVIGAVVLLSLPLALLLGDPQALLRPLHDVGAWPWLLAGGITGAAIPTTLLLGGMGIIGPSRTAILMTLEPLVGVAIAGLLLGEEPLPLQLVGGAAVLAAAVVLQAGPRRGPRALPEDTGEYQQVV